MVPTRSRLRTGRSDVSGGKKRKKVSRPTFVYGAKTRGSKLQAVGMFRSERAGRIFLKDNKILYACLELHALYDSTSPRVVERTVEFHPRSRP